MIDAVSRIAWLSTTIDRAGWSPVLASMYAGVGEEWASGACPAEGSRVATVFFAWCYERFLRPGRADFGLVFLPPQSLGRGVRMSFPAQAAKARRVLAEGRTLVVPLLYEPVGSASLHATAVVFKNGTCYMVDSSYDPTDAERGAMWAMIEVGFIDRVAPGWPRVRYPGNAVQRGSTCGPSSLLLAMGLVDGRRFSPDAADAYALTLGGAMLGCTRPVRGPGGDSRHTPPARRLHKLCRCLGGVRA
jgi:hypothetical protein